MSHSLYQQKKTFERFYILEYEQSELKSPNSEDSKNFGYIKELFLYPTLEKDDLKIKVKPFVFVGIENNLEEGLSSREIFYCVLTLADGKRMFVYCLRNYQVNVSEPLTFLFITKSGYFNLFKDILKEIEKIYNVSMDYLDPFLQILQKRSLPQKGKSLKISLSPQLKLSNNQFEFHRPDVPLCDFPLIELFSRFNGRDILRIFAALILERRIIFISSNLTILTSSIYSSISLIRPLKWSVILIPIVPKQLTDACYAPIPYVLGIHKIFENQIKEYDLEEITIIDLDKKEIESDPVDLVLLPSLQATKLIKNLNKHLNEWNETKQFPREKIVGEFTNFIKDIFKGIEDHFVPNNENKDELEFNFKSFHSRKSRRIKKFLTAFEQTQMFENYLQEIKQKILKESNTQEIDFTSSIKKIKLQQQQQQQQKQQQQQQTQNQKNLKSQNSQQKPSIKSISKLTQTKIKSRLYHKKKKKVEKGNNIKNKNNNSNNHMNSNDKPNNNNFKNLLNNKKKKDPQIYPSMKYMIDEISQTIKKRQNFKKRNSEKNLDLEDLNKDLEIINLENGNGNENKNNPDREMLNVISDMVSKQNPKRLSNKFFFSTNHLDLQETNNNFLEIRGRARIEMMKNLNNLKQLEQNENNEQKIKKTKKIIKIKGQNSQKRARNQKRSRSRNFSLKFFNSPSSSKKRKEKKNNTSENNNDHANDNINNTNLITNNINNNNNKVNNHNKSNGCNTQSNQLNKNNSPRNFSRSNPLIQGRKFGQPIQIKNHKQPISSHNPHNNKSLENTINENSTSDNNKKIQTNPNILSKKQLVPIKKTNHLSKDLVPPINMNANNNSKVNHNIAFPPIPPRNRNQNRNKNDNKKVGTSYNAVNKNKKLYKDYSKYNHRNIRNNNSKINNKIVQSQQNENNRMTNKKPIYENNDCKSPRMNKTNENKHLNNQNIHKNNNNNKEINTNLIKNKPNKNIISKEKKLKNSLKEKKEQKNTLNSSIKKASEIALPPIPPRNKNKNKNKNIIVVSNNQNNKKLFKNQYKKENNDCKSPRIIKTKKVTNLFENTEKSKKNPKNELDQSYKNKKLPNLPKQNIINSNGNKHLNNQNIHKNKNNNKEINTNLKKNKPSKNITSKEKKLKNSLKEKKEQKNTLNSSIKKASEMERPPISQRNKNKNKNKTNIVVNNNHKNKKITNKKSIYENNDCKSPRINKTKKVTNLFENQKNSNQNPKNELDQSYKNKKLPNLPKQNIINPNKNKHFNNQNIHKNNNTVNTKKNIKSKSPTNNKSNQKKNSKTFSQKNHKNVSRKLYKTKINEKKNDFKKTQFNSNQTKKVNSHYQNNNFGNYSQLHKKNENVKKISPSNAQNTRYKYQVGKPIDERKKQIVHTKIKSNTIKPILPIKALPKVTTTTTTTTNLNITTRSNVNPYLKTKNNINKKHENTQNKLYRSKNSRFISRPYFSRKMYYEMNNPLKVKKLSTKNPWLQAEKRENN
ncbi:suppression of tumorigenicity 5 st5 [Anaeramoeba flamelloides]|uniref:Suppression of tumorigenicity 5 st5 n=1 Tax=Anaeramoeba flamelloides TaxID=1746091 RepID=A0AAV7ZMZ1_9EUKA|nr:suppression of tumorigenicity 5 st5 [Anaeramoeba flamelloides]